jgi:hypothetical protein
MTIDYSQLPLAKGRPAKLAKADRAKTREGLDAAESAAVKVRSGGRCEVVSFGARRLLERCKRRAFHVHHMLGGIGVRARGKSALAIHKQHVCSDCHSDITGHVLRRVGGDVPLWTDEYERAE